MYSNIKTLYNINLQTRNQASINTARYAVLYKNSLGRAGVGEAILSRTRLWNEVVGVEEFDQVDEIKVEMLINVSQIVNLQNSKQ